MKNKLLLSTIIAGLCLSTQVQAADLTKNEAKSDVSASEPRSEVLAENATLTMDEAEKTAQDESQETKILAAENEILPAKQTSYVQDGVEIEFEYLNSANFKFDERSIDTYNTHVLTRGKTMHALTMYYGLTLSRALGDMVEDGEHLDSQALGVGPTVMLRWERPLKGKLAADLDVSGSALIYDDDHPATGRGYGFLWRIGPRLTYSFDAKNSFTVGYTFAHYSNGMRKHNPGYNGAGITLGYQYRF